jgi:hypothetical protein
LVESRADLDLGNHVTTSFSLPVHLMQCGS